MKNKCMNCKRPLYIICGECLDKDLERLSNILDFPVNKKQMRISIAQLRLKYKCLVMQEIERGCKSHG